MTSGTKNMNVRHKNQSNFFLNFRPNVGVMEDSNHFSSPEMITPNLDKLAERSLVLTKAYTQVLFLTKYHSSEILSDG